MKSPTCVIHHARRLRHPGAVESAAACGCAGTARLRPSPRKLRLVEGALRTGRLGRIGLRDDPDNDAIALNRLQRTISDRRRARVPEHLISARDRASQIKDQRMTTVLAHLRSGRGIASRPRERHTT